jgi:glycosyltransferase involved in cell wall biosynthesis
VYLHVGTPKSGTTYLQSLLYSNREALRERGVLYPGRRPFDQNRASLDVRHGRHLSSTDPHKDPQTPGARTTWATLLEEIEAFDGVAVLSNEWYVEADDDQVRGVVEQVGTDRLHVVITTRNLVRLVPAAWQESLKIGRGHSLADFVASLDSPDDTWSWPRVDPAEIARHWAKVIPAERIHVVTSPEDPSDRDLLWRRFASTVGFEIEGLDPLPRQANESLSVQAARLLQEFGPALRAEVDRRHTGWQAKFRWLRVEVAQRILAVHPGEPIGVDEDLLRELDERSAHAADALAELGCSVTGDLAELRGGTNRSGARLPSDVTESELLAAAETLAVGLLASRLEAERESDSETGRPGRRGQRREPDVPQHNPRRAARSDAPSPMAERAHVAVDRARGAARLVRRQARRWQGGLASRDRTRRVTFMVPFAYGMGGIPRTVFTVANALAQRDYEVSLVTLVRNNEEPYFSLDPRVTLVPLDDRIDPSSPGGMRPRPRQDKSQPPRVRQLDRKPSTLMAGTHSSFSAYVDELMRRHLESLKPGVIVSTRPEFTVAALRWSHPDSIVVHQEHLSFVGRKMALREGSRDLALRRGVERPVDAFLTLTDADLERWQRFVGESDTRWGVIPNATPFDVDEPAPLSSRTVLAAGRFTHQKGFDRLVAAYAPLAESHPDWQLHIYGHGELWEQISAQVGGLDVGDRIQLKGITSEFEAVLKNASVYAMSSRFEGLPMVLLEAFSKGVPPVSFDCPEGPRQLIEDGVNGLLVPEGDVPALTQALRGVMDDDDLRRRLGAGALRSAAEYHVDAVVERWISLFEELDGKRRARG